MTSATSTATGESGKGILRDFNAPPGRRPRRDACLTAAKHLPDRSRRVRLASASEMTLCGQRLRYLPQRLSLSVQLAHQRDDFRNLLSVCEAPTATATCRHLALARGSQFGDQVRLLKLADGPEYLSHQHCGRSVGRERGVKGHVAPCQNQSNHRTAA